MANKVLTVKMDEKDIERIKKCYKALVNAGFLSAQTMSLNAFYKHLLLDYLEFDISNAFDTFSEYGISPRCVNPNEIDDKGSISLTNTYNFDDEIFDLYKKCVKESLTRQVDMMKENAKLLDELVEAEVVIRGGFMNEMKYEFYRDIDEQESSFWNKKALEIMELIDKAYRDNGIDDDIEMIQNSSITEDEKKELINHIMEYEKKRKQNFCIRQGRGIIQ